MSTLVIDEVDESVGLLIHAEVREVPHVVELAPVSAGLIVAGKVFKVVAGVPGGIVLGPLRANLGVLRRGDAVRVQVPAMELDSCTSGIWPLLGSVWTVDVQRFSTFSFAQILPRDSPNLRRWRGEETLYVRTLFVHSKSRTTTLL